MKIFGYEVSEGQNDPCEPAELAEITLNATPDELRRISKFLTDVADQMSGWKDKTHHWLAVNWREMFAVKWRGNTCARQLDLRRVIALGTIETIRLPFVREFFLVPMY
jgi:hypothetical protein